MVILLTWIRLRIHISLILMKRTVHPYVYKSSLTTGREERIGDGEALIAVEVQAGLRIWIRLFLGGRIRFRIRFSSTRIRRPALIYPDNISIILTIVYWLKLFSQLQLKKNYQIVVLLIFHYVGCDIFRSFVEVNQAI